MLWYQVKPRIGGDMVDHEHILSDVEIASGLSHPIWISFQNIKYGHQTGGYQQVLEFVLSTGVLALLYQ